MGAAEPGAKPPRAPWQEFPEVLIHASESAVKQHPAYVAAKSGDDLAARVLVGDTIDVGKVRALEGLLMGGKVLAPVVLTGKPYSARLALTGKTLDQLRKSHGAELEQWWEGRFAHAFDALTESEARYLARTADADAARNRIVAAEQA